jgi:hypothetical protein
MIHPAAKGERFLAVAEDFLSMLDVAKILRSCLGPCPTLNILLPALS